MRLNDNNTEAWLPFMETDQSYLLGKYVRVLVLVIVVTYGEISKIWYKKVTELGLKVGKDLNKRLKCIPSYRHGSRFLHLF